MILLRYSYLYQLLNMVGFPFLCLNDNLTFLDEIVKCSSLTIQSHVSRNTSIPIEVLFSLVMGLPSEASLEVCSKLLEIVGSVISIAC
jgi:hypothetical protein